MWSFLWWIVAATPPEGGGIGIPPSIIVAAITLIGTVGASYLMFRGKTQDTANWLITELRNEAKSARESAHECAAAREVDRETIDDLKIQIHVLASQVHTMREQLAKHPKQE